MVYLVVVVEENAFGVSRHIPEDVKRSVRQACAFGCVICGCLPYTYEHYDPPFAELRGAHDAAGIALLCGSCQLDKSAGRVAAESVREAHRSPAARQGGAKWTARPGSSGLDLVFGCSRPAGVTMMGTRAVGISCATDGDILVVRREPTAPARCVLTANLRGPDGVTVLAICDNELRVPGEAWDFTMSGQRLVVRSAPVEPRTLGAVVLALVFDPECSEFRVERLHMRSRSGRHLMMVGPNLTSVAGERAALIIHGHFSVAFEPGTVLKTDASSETFCLT